ncbi:MAG TPA: hybrid sensor histidine kinase/response regulator [Anaerolineae bacterium]|nr:hybrid sensor histidine kinase/response regulator [Anaerolineae bacterium]
MINIDNTDNQPKILIVDDDPVSHIILEGYLQPDNYQIHYVAGGEKALKLVKDIKPDLVILDIMMPGISGFDVCKILKNDKATCDIPVIFTTALSDPYSHEMGIESGAEGFIVKPFNQGLIRAYVKVFIKMKKTLDNSRQRLARNKDFTSMIIHDLTNLNMAISGNLELAMTELDESASAKNYMRKALYILKSSSKMLEKAQDITCFKSTVSNMDFNPVNLIDLIKKASGLFETEMESKNLRFDLQKSDPVLVRGDSGLLLRVLVNLIGNAIESSQTGTEIDIAVTKKKEETKGPVQYVELTVSNQCSPIPEKYHKMIFERFKQAPNRGTIRQGHGLGLAFCKLVIESHKGRIWVESPLPGEEGGVAVHFTLPGALMEEAGLELKRGVKFKKATNLTKRDLCITPVLSLRLAKAPNVAKGASKAISSLISHKIATSPCSLQ